MEVRAPILLVVMGVLIVMSIVIVMPRDLNPLYFSDIAQFPKENIKQILPEASVLHVRPGYQNT